MTKAQASKLFPERNEFAMTLTQKEKDLLKDLADGEKLCRDKYAKYAADAKDPQLKNLFSELSKIEGSHYNIITGMQAGDVPANMTGNPLNLTFTQNYNCTNTPDKETDAYYCSDVLSMEKHISGLYDTCVFEFEAEDARHALSSIQKDEQNHGKLIYDYMKTNCMYG